MGNEKEDSGFGFKDRAKAEETLRLLQQHDPNYRRLTVRGLLGRAKRVLSMTKAEEKIKNIKEAMQVFEAWLADLDAAKGQADDKPAKRKDKKEEADKHKNGDDKESGSDAEMEDKSEAKPADTVPGLGFKDKEAAESSLRALEGRDPDYQRLAVRGLVGRAKRVLTCTRDETKLGNLRAALAVLEQFLTEFEEQQRARHACPHLPLAAARACRALPRAAPSDQQSAFLEAYAAVGGEYKRLRTVPAPGGERTWDIVRNAALQELREKHADAPLFDDAGQPTAEHLEMLLWAYSPEPAKINKLFPDADKKETSDRKRRSSATDDTPSKKKKEESS